MRYVSMIYSLGVFVGIGLGVGCTNLLGGHCANNEGDATCAGRGYCSSCIMEGDGCTNERPSDDCYFPGGGSDGETDVASITVGTETVSVTITVGMTADEVTTIESSTESSVTTESMPDCTTNEDCTQAVAPICGLDGRCVACNDKDAPDDACGSLGKGELPVCKEDGSCVQCTSAESDACMDTTPVCDNESNTCKCTEHEHCYELDGGGPGCNLFTGECLPVGAVVHVDPMGPPVYDFDSLRDAAESFPPGAAATIIVHEGNYNNEVLTIGSGQVLAFLASEGDDPTWDNGVDVVYPQLTINDGAVLIDGLILFQYGNIDEPGAVHVNGKGSRVWLDRSQIINNAGGVRAENGAHATLRNCFVEGEPDTIAVEVNGASADIIYSTVATSTFGSTPALGCTSPGVVEIRNSIIVSQGGTPPDELACNGASVSIENIATEESLNVELNPGWFENYTFGDFHLTPMGASTFEDLALWQIGDPSTDIDGDLRPNMDGEPDVAGADIRQ